uniref:Uncharacterized protein n=1 Tax=Photinus pyralis TaxID=7054 RepID=A0A1Y1LCN1_PHOPY
MGRTPRTTLPTNKMNLIPKWDYLPDYIRRRKIEIQVYTDNFNKHHRTKVVQNLNVNDRVWITNLKKYGVVVNEGPEPRSYVVIADNKHYRRNRSHLIKANDTANDTLNRYPYELFEWPEELEDRTSTQEDLKRGGRAEERSLTEETEQRPLVGNDYVQSNEDNGVTRGVIPAEQQFYTTRSGRVVRPPRSRCECGNLACSH